MKLNSIFGLFSHGVAIVLLTSCGTTPVEPVRPTQNKSGEAFIRVNKMLLKKDKELIKTYIKRHNYNMTETETGLWFEVVEPGKGIPALINSIATVKYKVELLDGTICYSSDSLGLKSFVLGSGKVEAGLDEGVLKLKTGGKIRLILPPHLGYGLSGDNNRIPPRSILVYYVELLDVKNKL